MNPIDLGNTKVGDGMPCYVIAEIGGLFRNFDEAKRLIDTAKEIGVDSVKFQTLEAETVTTKDNFFDMENTGHISQYELLKDFEIPKDVQMEVVEYANKLGMTIFSAPSHINDLEIMKKMELPIFKIGSDLACHIPLLKEIASLKKPIILSTGMCSMEEVRNSVDAIHSCGNDKLAILHCVSNYPSKPEETNLNAIITMKNEFDVPVGLSDHCIGSSVVLGAAAMGANLIEKHFRDERNTPSPDDIVALDKNQFSSLIKSIREIETAKGNGVKEPTKSEKKNMITNRVSIIILRDLAKGTILTEDMIDVRRPGTGLSPKFYDTVLGKKIKRDVKKEEPLTSEIIG
ncbi:MAG: N-acylneuraminate-9-phosphate synthase [Chloroflexi bacterium]|nr:N-acylneuraminate-9-phosphate synthase [Chloroflexota bacterium]MBL76839.1 N-acylneuraminate-9-phosphate synthase [Chloroflexota bacterium]